ncbi:MAG: PH domain-containing protein [Planctomycetaceae bacterium]|nr:PH domain-containing protein [Planctomycetaceae bacterium]
MAVVAPLAKYKKTNYKIWFMILFIAGVWFLYDGKYNQKLIAKHTKDGKADPTLVFHRKAPPYMIGAACLVAIYAYSMRNKRIVAADEKLILSDIEEIPYKSIESINKTDYDAKGTFIITYKGKDGKVAEKKISNKSWDNMDEVLEVLVSQITG